MTAIIFSRLIGPVPIDCIVREVPIHRLGISRIPIESGANITDHAYIDPKRIRFEVADAQAVATFNALTAFQESRVPFTVVSGLYVYTNMLISEIGALRDIEWSQVLSSGIELQEAIIVETAYAASDTSSDAGGQPGGKNSTKAATPSSGRSGDSATADRASGPVTRGDQAAKPATNTSILRGAF